MKAKHHALCGRQKRNGGGGEEKEGHRSASPIKCSGRKEKKKGAKNFYDIKVGKGIGDLLRRTRRMCFFRRRRTEKKRKILTICNEGGTISGKGGHWRDEVKRGGDVDSAGLSDRPSSLRRIGGEGEKEKKRRKRGKRESERTGTPRTPL